MVGKLLYGILVKNNECVIYLYQMCGGLGVLTNALASKSSIWPQLVTQVNL